MRTFERIANVAELLRLNPHYMAIMYVAIM